MRPGSLFSRDELAARIRLGRRLFVAGDEALLRRLPEGEWVGGTIPYFITDEGGLRSRERAYAAEVPPFATGARIKAYDPRSLADVYVDGPGHGYTLLVVPAFGRAVAEFALKARLYEGFARRPLVGWVAGVDLSELGSAVPRVFDGRDGSCLEDGALALHVALPPGKTAEVGIVNIFSPGDGEELTFGEDGFTAKEVLVDGRRRPLAEYLVETRLDTRLPLVADYRGAPVNTSIRRVDPGSGEVSFYAPVFRGVRYRHSRRVADYAAALSARMPRDINGDVAFSCSCILNYVHGGFEGRRVEGVRGPVTFGELAYQLLNQTLVYLTIRDAV